MLEPLRGLAVVGSRVAPSPILATGWAGPSRRPKTISHAVEVNSLGAALAIKSAEQAGHPAAERIVRYQLAAFIRGARQVMGDRIAMKKGLEQVYA